MYERTDGLTERLKLHVYTSRYKFQGYNEQNMILLKHTFGDVERIIFTYFFYIFYLLLSKFLHIHVYTLLILIAVQVKSKQVCFRKLRMLL